MKSGKEDTRDGEKTAPAKPTPYQPGENRSRTPSPHLKRALVKSGKEDTREGEKTAPAKPTPYKHSESSSTLERALSPHLKPTANISVDHKEASSPEHTRKEGKQHSVSSIIKRLSTSNVGKDTAEASPTEASSKASSKVSSAEETKRHSVGSLIKRLSGPGTPTSPINISSNPSYGLVESGSNLPKESSFDDYVPVEKPVALKKGPKPNVLSSMGISEEYEYVNPLKLPSPPPSK